MDIKCYRKPISLVFLILAMLIFSMGCERTENLQVEKPANKLISQATNQAILEGETKFLEDMTGLIKTVEETHPAFVLNDLPSNYEEEKGVILDEVKKTTSDTDFRFLVMRYLALLRDGHTRMVQDSSQKYLDMEIEYIDGALFALDDAGKVTNRKVTHIGDLPILEIFKAVDLYYAAENDSAKRLNYSQYSMSKLLLKQVGCKIDHGTVKIAFESKGMVTSENHKFKSKDYDRIYDYSSEVSSKLYGDTFYIDMNVCNVNNVLKKQTEKLKSTIESGIKKVVIDIRNNPGGNSMACTNLLMAMDMSPPSIGANVRGSELAKSQRNDVTKEGLQNYEPDLKTSKPNKEISLVVLTNEHTYSSATMLATMVQDGKLGIIIGTPSSNAPSSYGDILYYTLPNNKIDTSISYKRFCRPDQQANQRMLVPDIMTDVNIDSLEVALDYLSNK